MSKSSLKIAIAAALITVGTAQISVAQSTSNSPVLDTTSPTRNVIRQPIKRDVQPVEYWVESSALNLRDNPVAGKVVGNLSYGQKILAYDQYENWIRVSKLDEKQQWVNSDFLSNSSLSWASYVRPSSTLNADVIPVRIKDPEDRKMRMFGVRLKKSETGNALITTQLHTKTGIFYQNRFVSCDDKKAIGVRLIGEGSTFLRAQNDARNLGLDIYGQEQIEDEAHNSAASAISSFACKAEAF